VPEDRLTLRLGGFTLSSKDTAVRRFWVEHALRSREVSAHIGRRQGAPVESEVLGAIREYDLAVARKR
jgi:L-rhamnose isomerase